jgi:SAM-dependent methyltransferase
MTDPPSIVEAPPPCPVCGTPSSPRHFLPASFLKEQLSQYYLEELPTALQLRDYHMHACPRCTLEFAWPLVEGDSVFYDWITRHRTYYPDDRWEWGQTRERLAADVRPVKLLEIGSGSGAFLASLHSLAHVTSIGLDPTEGSAELCRAKGLEVYAETLAGYAANPDHAIQSFDVVLAFHCLEHISDPRGLVADMLKLLAPGGRIFLSTPYSPMSFETIWYDPLNHPPHHMTRWNRSAYVALGRQFGLATSLSMPQPMPLLDRVASAFNFALNGPQRLQPRRQILARAMRKPRAFLTEMFRQAARDRIGGRVAADVVLIEYTHAGGGTSA